MKLCNIVLFALVALVPASVHAAEPAACAKPRIADGGWTDNTAQNGLLITVAKALGYEPKVDLLSVPIILQSLKHRDIDIWLDNWLPSQDADIAPFMADGSIVKFATNLDGAGYGPVVPDYVAGAGVKDLKDLAKFGDKFDNKFYGIEAGNDGNRIIQTEINDPANGLKTWKLVESSEQGMLAQAQRAMQKKEWVVFLGWAPHPVMSKMALVYLTGFEKDGFGNATVHTLTRVGYAGDCPNFGKLLTNLKFTLDMEGAIMADILAKKDAEASAGAWLKANPAALESWLTGVTTLDGKDGLVAVKAALGISGS